MFEGLFQPMHLIVILAIVVLIFGPKKLPELGKGLGEAIRGFQNSVKGTDAAPEASTPKALPGEGKNDP
jgi:sec-independent protein translocase protein TatA